MNYKSYSDAAKRGANDVWPGCGIIGRCMPCRNIHNYNYRAHVDGPMIDDYRCTRNHTSGCPYPKPDPEHDINRQGRCRRCGRRP